MKGAGWWAFLVVLFILATIADRDTLAMLVLMLALTTVVSARWGRNTEPRRHAHPRQEQFALR